MDFDDEMKRLLFLTTYKKDYVEKPIKLVSPLSKCQEFKDPLTEGFRNLLQLDKENLTLPDEDGELYLEKFKEKNEKIGRMHFKEPLNKKIIIENEVTKLTEYQNNYCDIEKDVLFHPKQSSGDIHFSNDIYVPLTTYKNFYRDPALFAKTESIIIRPPDSLQAHGNLVTQPITEYYDKIGRIGGLIVEENFKRLQKSKTDTQ